jgi:hypothetical protein
MLVFGALIFYAAVAAAISPAAALDLAGTVERLQGVATATRTSGSARSLQVGSTVIAGDSVTTQSDSRLQLGINDAMVLTLGHNSTIMIETSRPNHELRKTFISLIQGVFFAADESDAGTTGARSTISTPVATLELHGGSIFAEHTGEKSSIVLLAGAGATITTDSGQVELSLEEMGIDIVPGESPPMPTRWSFERLTDSRAAVSFN